MFDQDIPPAYTFDDVLLVPSDSDVLPSEVSLATRLTDTVYLNAPLVSAAMDTVTEHRTAIAMARSGGIGIVHKNMSISDQAREVERVKKSESGMIIDPVTVTEQQSVGEVEEIMAMYKISGLPVLREGKLVGIVTNRDLRFVSNHEMRVSDVMTSKNLITVHEGISLEHCKALLHEHRIEKLLVVDKQKNLKGLITIKDIEKIKKYPLSAKDDNGRLLVGAAVGVGSDMPNRTEALVEAGVDVIVLDSAHGHSAGVLQAIREIRAGWPALSVIAGNVATAEGTAALIDAGANAVKIGVGPGSICTTRIVAGVGVPQLTALQNATKVAREKGIPVIADGGIKFSGDICKAIGIGADCVMIGSLFAGTDETPGETFLYQGRKYKGYRGMGSLGAMKQGSSDRYFQKKESESSKLVPEGIEGKVPYRGPISEMIYQLLGGLRSGMGYSGASTIGELHKKAKFVRISPAGLRESHVHDVIITREAPNYRTEEL
ncbi:MAG: IMP dehydrogenase [Candidatus Electrothrix sp. AW2]|jgi:IMP dehydrogenase|nr:IMP dehydrogenase [Candidatus Electrothrix sp. AX1]MCI5117658.1 IMP dehydrogenase [Candidatus Electrothrix gigas]MCI5129018.1 IMP dehydrogenase [Candidatus Electrothrix gigas]MCI5135270.1 IMP dehydrogenase [Candidatus Electrothrix gigas]MCI5178288.1 IMP dehydrogenase [Candidatus Electrothrix gigas]